MVLYKLTYFNMRARAEPIRTLFALAGVEFEDVRIAKEDWPAMKESTPLGQLPVLDVDGHQISQSVAIMRYLGRQFNLAGKTALEDARIDMFVDQMNDFINEIRPYVLVVYINTDQDKEKLHKEVFVPGRKKHFEILMKFLGGKDFLLDSVSWGDVILAVHLSTSRDMIIPDMFEGFPEMEAYVNRVLAVPRIKEYMAKRPPATPPVPFN